MTKIPMYVQEQADVHCEQIGLMWTTLGSLRDVIEDSMEPTHEWREIEDFMNEHDDSLIIFPSS